MRTAATSESIDHLRRSLLGAAALTVTTADLALARPAAAQARKADAPDSDPAASGAPAAFGPVQQIDAGPLSVGYVEIGPADGPPAVLLHGWPYDIHSFADAAPLLAAKGYRVIVPYLRGFGTTRFLSADTMRNGQPSVFALDTIALMDALQIQQAVIAGFDWGTRTADIVAVLWPERCKALVSVSGYSVGVPSATPQPPALEHQWWYEFYFATEQGRAGYAKNRHDFAKLIWRLASPKWNFDDATFDRSAAAFENADHVDITIHNYRRGRRSRFPPS